MTKLDYHLRERLEELHARTAVADEGAPGAAAEPIAVIVEFMGDPQDLEAVGFQSHALSEHPAEHYKISPGTIPLSRLEDLASIEHVVSVSQPEQYWPLLDYSVPDIGATALHNANPSRTGNGIVIGIIDSGIDWRHRDFVQSDDRTSRILGIWDQLLTPMAGETAGTGGIGVVYTQDQLNQAVQGTLKIRTLDLGTVRGKEDLRSKGHGTHVAGIAAGDGSSATCCHGANVYIGVAPRASLVVVRSDFNEDHVISGVDYILNHPAAAGKPVVINMSFGGTLGPHDGTSKVERYINSVVTAQPARAIVVAAGNSGDVSTEPCHVASTVAANGNVDVAFTVSDQIQGAASVDVWYARSGTLNATLTSPDGTVIGPAPGNGTNFGPVPANPGASADQRSQVTFFSAINDTVYNRDNNLKVQMTKPTKGSVPNGSWNLNLANPTGNPVSFHAWTSRPEVVKFLPPVSPPDGKIRASADSTVESPGTATEAITVANYASKTDCCDCCPSNDIVTSSSRGPVARGSAANPKPNIAAPGLEITSTNADAANLPGNCCSCCPDACCILYVDLTGTSMSAPHITGTIALMLEENPHLAKADILKYLTTSARAAPAPADPNTWGAGKVDANAAVMAVRAGGAGPAPTSPSGGGGAPHLALREPGGPVHHHHGPVPGGFLAMRRYLAAMPDGERLAAAASRHFSEVRRLINTNMRVATMWHRAQGPSLLRALVSGAGTGYADLGEREGRYLERFVEQLERYGSDRLRADLARYWPALVALLVPAAVPA
ncbi:MAG: S8 family serine peptidase [Streptosporangiaceae bacterium]|jgi:subtilisin family serine protease